MSQWTATYTNDPENDFTLTIVIKYKESELKKFILFSRDKDIAIPFNWLLELMKDANRKLIINERINKSFFSKFRFRR